MEEVSWLFEKLTDAFGTPIDFENNIAFYRRLADAAERYAKNTPKESQAAKGMLQTVTSAARLMAEEIK